MNRITLAQFITASCIGFSLGVFLASYQYEEALKSHELNERYITANDQQMVQWRKLDCPKPPLQQIRAKRQKGKP